MYEASDVETDKAVNHPIFYHVWNLITIF